jgi:hypothetical protein
MLEEVGLLLINFLSEEDIWKKMSETKTIQNFILLYANKSSDMRGLS